MRITESISNRNLLANVNMLNDRLARASAQASSGKKLGQLHDSPSGSSEMLQLNSQMSDLDQYQSNSDNAGFFLNITDSTLTSLYNVVTSVYARGSAAAGSSTNAGTLSTLAGEVRSLRDEIFSLANTQVRGRHIFAGSKVDTAAYTMNGDTVAYAGDTGVNEIDISNGLQLKQNIPGSEVFDPVFARVNDLLTAMDGGDKTAIKDALAQFSDMFSTVSQVRARLGVDLGKLQDAVFTRQGLQSNLESRQTDIGDADMVEVIFTVNRTQTALQAAFQVGSVLGQKSLMDYLL